MEETTTSSDELEKQKESAKKAFDPMAEPVVLAAAASVAFSWYQFYVQGNKMHGLFVGLWAPTLLGAASYLKNLRITKKIEESSSFE